MNKLHIHERICTPCSERVRKCVCWCSTKTLALAWCSQHLSKCMHIFRKKCTCNRACAPMQRCRSFFAMEAIANLPWVLREHRAGCRPSPALLPSQRNQSPDKVSLHLSQLRLAFFRHSIFLMFHTSFWNIAPLYFVNRFFIILALVCHQNGYYLHEYFDLWTQ